MLHIKGGKKNTTAQIKRKVPDQIRNHHVMQQMIMHPCCTNLCKRFLSIILEVFWVDIKVVFIDGEWLGALSNAGHKLLHLKKSTAWPICFKVPHRDVGGSDTVYKQQRKPVRGLKLKSANYKQGVRNYFVNIWKVYWLHPEPCCQ